MLVTNCGAGTLSLMEQSKIDQAAQRIIDRFGADAEMRAAETIERMLKRGDLADAARWTRIVKAIIEVQATE